MSDYIDDTLAKTIYREFILRQLTPFHREEMNEYTDIAYYFESNDEANCGEGVTAIFFVKRLNGIADDIAEVVGGRLFPDPQGLPERIRKLFPSEGSLL